jgi:drug/metabolite transporter superfamily protein YnfA
VYNVLADAIVVTHFLFIAFVISGGLLVIRWPRLVFLHLPAAVWGAAVEIFGWICPLTPLENHFRDLGGDASYSGDFIAKYLIPIIYPENLTLSIQQVFGVLVIIINIIFYIVALCKNKHSFQ